MASNEKYQMFKNFMYNELGITKEDIRDWIKEAVREEARKLINKTYDDYEVKEVVRKEIANPYSQIRDQIVKSASHELLGGLRLKVTIQDNQ